MAKTIVTVDQGGTGAETASAALTALGAAPSAFTQTGTDAVERTVDSKLKDTVSVMDFGATGLGAVDDSTEIQAAVNSLTTGGRLLFPRGTYKISTQVVIPGKIHLVGDAPNATRINADEDISPFKFYNASASNVYEGGGISDMSISSDDAAIVIEVVNVWGITIERIRFRDGGTPPSATLIQCSGESYETRIKDCRMVGADTFGVNFINDCNSSSIEGCDFGMKDGATAIQAQDCNATYIVNNRFEWAATEGGTAITLDNANSTNIAANSIGANTPPDSTHCQILIKGTSLHTTIDGNRIAQDVGMSQVITTQDTAKRVVISNNNFQIDGGVSCIVTNGRIDYVISDNQFTLNTDITGSIIDINGSSGNITVVGNVIDATGASSTGTGIRLRAGSTYASISNNMVQGIGGSGATGILIEANNSSPTSNVVNNICAGNTTDISVSSQASINCSGNIGLDISTFSGRVTLKKSSNSEVTALTDASTVALDFDDANNFSLLTTSGIGASRALGTPSNITAGQSGCIVITSDAAMRDLTYTSAWHFEGGTDPSLTQTSGGVDTLAYYCPTDAIVQAVLLKNMS